MPQNGIDVNIALKGIFRDLDGSFTMVIIGSSSSGPISEPSNSLIMLSEADMVRFSDGKIGCFPRLTSIKSRSSFEMNGCLKDKKT